MAWDFETDIVVVGAGGCGTMAAILAATLAESANVILLEKDAHQTCSSSISSGLLQAAGTRYQQAAGIKDSPEIMAEDILRRNKNTSDPELTLAVCRKTAEVVHWFADYLGIEMELAPEVDWLGHSYPRMHSNPRRQGNVLVQALRDKASALPNVTYADKTPGQGLIPDDRGAVIGVLAGHPPNIQRIHCKRVVLAAGGFGANHEMLIRYIPEISDALYVGSSSHTGEALMWGEQLGAALEDMSGYQGHGTIISGYGTRITPGVIYDGGIVVDVNGRRFEREDQGYSEWAGIVLRQPEGIGIVIWDARIHRRIEFVESTIESTQAGAIDKFDNLENLAHRFGINPETLAHTVEDYNEGVRRGQDTLGRKLLTQPLSPPFYATKTTGALAHTQGGLKIDVHGRVLRKDHTPIPNLYAGGNSAAGLSGPDASGYSSGNGLLMAYTLGRIIGEHLAASLENED